ncbi:Lactate utilization protein A [Pseudobythopirellula maris]|uniref:Lactate utilization protein A n=2 Tax=Pseudobythopirellula maris TaxID=2527991 RepID=A0A5C5ZK16_9BACT|nr:Lactate utilization protein A [Pseudobythopirellula maris]
MADVLERLGCTVDYPESQTCCGQPAFNCGYQEEAAKVADHFLRCFSQSEQVVVPSGSCAAMVKHFYKDLFRDTPREAEATRIGERTHEFSQFLVHQMGASDVGAKLPGRATFHDGCHGLRELGVKSEPRLLLEQVDGLELVEMTEAETCCGFGGTFSVKFPQVSTSMVEVKTESIEATGAEYVVSNDPSCLMQIQGYLTRQKKKPKCMHLAEVLASR